jgi:asparagine synthase (glutamine-hydrolysing)
MVVTESDFLEAIPEVIENIESYDTTTVRASLGNYLLGKYIAQHSDAKVIFNGDGSDELAGGYLYMRRAPDALAYDKETQRLLRDIHAFDVLRSDKCISSHGLEPRTPFLDRYFVQYYLSIPSGERFSVRQEKEWIRAAFDVNTTEGKPYLPSEVLWRRKEAFSDGVSMTTRSLYQIIQEHVQSKSNKTNKQTYEHLPPQTPEQAYYRDCFETHFPGLGTIVPYFWMPKFVQATDASARTLDLYCVPTAS